MLRKKLSPSQRGSLRPQDRLRKLPALAFPRPASQMGPNRPYHCTVAHQRLAGLTPIRVIRNSVSVGTLSGRRQSKKKFVRDMLFSEFPHDFPCAFPARRNQMQELRQVIKQGHADIIDSYVFSTALRTSVNQSI
jgi:hypothetical protein